MAPGRRDILKGALLVGGAGLGFSVPPLFEKGLALCRTVSTTYRLEAPPELGEALRLAVADLDVRRAGRPLAVCVSGGFDSDLLAREIVRQGLPAKFYFMDVWGQNGGLAEHLRAFERETSARVTRVALGANEFRARLPELLAVTDFRSPHYLLMTDFLGRLPRGEFVVVGEGDFNKCRSALYGPRDYALIRRRTGPSGGDARLPSHYGEQVYHRVAGRLGLEGEFYFFRSRPELVVGVLQDPALDIWPMGVDSRALWAARFPELRPRAIQRIWPEGSTARREVRAWIDAAARERGLGAAHPIVPMEIRWRFDRRLDAVV